MEKITKIYSNGVIANKNVNFKLVEGEIPPPVGIIYQKDTELSNASAEFIDTMLKHHF